jgi:poly-gamma-glutamate capsule biosynthesis protein CapA/YwtB (metallophosphatase superfamily)
MVCLSLVAGGDVALGGTLSACAAADLDARVRAVASLFASADLSVASLDCAMAVDGASPNPEEYVVDAPTENLLALQQLGLGMVSLANNHSTDRGIDALVNGREVLRKHGIESVGAGGNESAARAPVIAEVAGCRVGFLAFGSAEPWVGSLPASGAIGGVAPLVETEAIAAVRELSQEVDAVVVCVHWGKEYVSLPAPAIVALGRCLVDAGASVVLGTHPHVPQAVETYGAGVICYSLGNLLFPGYPDQGLRFHGLGRQSIVASIRLQGGRATVERLTVVSFDDEGYMSLVAADEAERLLEKLASDLPMLGTPRHDRAWKQAVRKHEMDRLRRVWREEVVAVGWRAGTSRLMRLGRKNLTSVGRSVGEILWSGKGEAR